MPFLEDTVKGEFNSASDCNSLQLRFNQLIGLLSQEHDSVLLGTVHKIATRLAFVTFLALTMFFQALMLATVANIQVFESKPLQEDQKNANS